MIFEICFCDSSIDMAIYRGCSWQLLAHRFCNALDPNIPMDSAADKATKGYIITNYLQPDSANYDGVNIINKCIRVFQRRYVLCEG